MSSIVKQIPNGIDIRINRWSSSKNIFNDHKEFFNEVVYNSGYKDKFEF